MGEMTKAAAPGTLHRRDAVERLLDNRGELLVVTGLGSPTYDTFAAGDHAGNFYLWGAMGGAAMTGLGLALAQPDRPVAVITGDGEQLMGIGALATIAVQKPANLSIVILDNGHYGETGGQLSHSGAGVDLAQVASAMGIAEVLDVRDQAGLAAARDALHTPGNGPKVIAVRIVNEETPRALPTRDGGYLKDRFRAHLGFVPQ